VPHHIKKSAKMAFYIFEQPAIRVIHNSKNAKEAPKYKKYISYQEQWW